MYKNAKTKGVLEQTILTLTDTALRCVRQIQIVVIGHAYE